ncbi:MAG: hypothetical protein ACLFU7_05710, partial [Armatimonadota bacterium]
MRRYPQQPVQITSPWDGDVLNRHDGDETDAGLAITVEGTAPAGEEVRVAGRTAEREGDTFSAGVTLTEPRSTIVATSASGSDSVRVIYDRRSRKRFRFSVDDNILFLRDIAREKPDSLFDHWYLAFWQEMNARFGAKIHINIYYQCEGFILPEMPDQWRDEWAANADWLHLSFHGLQNEPAWIYRNAPGRRIARDFEMVTDEIERFATLEVTGNTTTVHWAEATRGGCVALRERGIERLIGLPGFHPNGAPKTSYYLDRPHARRLLERDAWWDADTDIIFITCDEVVNSHPLERVPEVLDAQAQSPHTSELIELLIHEQYFREELINYQPDIREKVIASLEWVTERGYEPCFWCDGLLGNT